MIRLKDLREDKDLLQKDIAKILNIAQRTYSGYETEAREMSYDLLKKVAIFYNTSIDYIVGLTNTKEPYPRNKKTT